MPRTDVREYTPIRINTTRDELKEWERMQKERGFKSLSGYIRSCVKHDIYRYNLNKKEEQNG